MELDFFTIYGLLAAGALILLVTAHIAYVYPRAAVPMGFFLILVADTKFRVRAVAEAVAGEVDRQILLELALYALIATVTAMLLATLRRERRSLWLDLPSCGYVLVCVASVAWSVAPKVTMVRSVQVLILFVFVNASLRVTGSERIFRAVAGSCTIYVLLCTALALIFPELRNQVLGRFGWFAVHPISAGGVTAIAALSILGTGLYSERGWHDRLLRCPVWLYLLPLVTVLLMTKSRGPLLAFIVGAGFLVLKRLRSHTATMIVSVGLLLMCAVVVSIGDLSYYLQQSATRGTFDRLVVEQILRGQTADQFLALSGRAELWANAIQPFYQQPITGYGYQASRALLLSEVFWAGHAHNAYLQTLLDVGILGGVFLFSSLIIVFLRGLRRRRRTRVHWEAEAMYGSIVFLLLNAITDESFAVVGLQLAVAFTSVSVVAQQTLAESQLQWRARRRVGPNRRGIVKAPALPLQG